MDLSTENAVTVARSTGRDDTDGSISLREDGFHDPRLHEREWLASQTKKVVEEEASSEGQGAEINEMNRHSLVKVVGTSTALDGTICYLTGRSTKFGWISYNGRSYRIPVDNLQLYLTKEDSEHLAAVRKSATAMAAKVTEEGAQRARESLESELASAAAEAQAEKAAELEAQKTAEALMGILPPPPDMATDLIEGPVTKGSWVKVLNVEGFDKNTISYVTGVSSFNAWVSYNGTLYKLAKHQLGLYAPAEVQVRRASSFGRFRRGSSFKRASSSSKMSSGAAADLEAATEEASVKAEAQAAAVEMMSTAVQKDAEEAAPATEGASALIRKGSLVRLVDSILEGDQSIGYVTGVSKKWVWICIDRKLYKAGHDQVQSYQPSDSHGEDAQAQEVGPSA
mmetsp:Transcript_24473/g.60722  ORF Transcript_24473/g.60722 Transcript_24473/m.60722 type:complete len:397 (-) Transcript_24473:341-1531(-)